MSDEHEKLRKVYVDARDGVEKAELALAEASGKLSRAIGKYVQAAQNFLPKSDMALSLALPPLPDDFELLQLEEQPEIVYVTGNGASQYLVLCPHTHAWRVPADGERHVVVARKRQVTS